MTDPMMDDKTAIAAITFLTAIGIAATIAGVSGLIYWVGL